MTEKKDLIKVCCATSLKNLARWWTAGVRALGSTRGAALPGSPALLGQPHKAAFFRWRPALP